MPRFCILNLTQLLPIIILVARRKRYSEAVAQRCSVKKVLLTPSMAVSGYFL